MKTVDPPVPRLESQDSPRTVSTSRTSLQKISKAVAPRDTKLDSERELTKSNLFSAQPFREKEIRRPFRCKHNRRRTSPKGESGKSFLDREIFTKRYPLNFHSGKKVNQPILSHESDD
jgi:hypothetical protein